MDAFTTKDWEQEKHFKSDVFFWHTSKQGNLLTMDDLYESIKLNSSK